jgi:hypothetical protein
MTNSWLRSSWKPNQKPALKIQGIASGFQPQTSKAYLPVHLAALWVPVPNYFGKAVGCFKPAIGRCGGTIAALRHRRTLT